jgi:hypothetical protein
MAKPPLDDNAISEVRRAAGPIADLLGQRFRLEPMDHYLLSLELSEVAYRALNDPDLPTDPRFALKSKP